MRMFDMENGSGSVRCSAMDSSVNVPLTVDGSPSSANSSDMFLYDDSSMSDGSLYASDQENHSVPRKRYVFARHIKISSDIASKHCEL